jgi:ribonuclease III
MHDQLDIKRIEGIIGYKFNQKRYIVCALTRRSFWHENRATCSENNERMEFLGDAVLGLVIGHVLYRKFPDDDEGELQKKRASLVNRAALAQLMRELDLAQFIRMGKGDEMSGCRELDSILADTLEAVIAAVYLDGGFASAEKMIEKHFYPMIQSCGTREGTEDYRSILQERVQAERGVTPHYELVDEWGEDHRKTFCVAVFLGEEKAGTGTGSNKREAAQEAAREALEEM